MSINDWWPSHAIFEREPLSSISAKSYVSDEAQRSGDTSARGVAYGRSSARVGRCALP